MDNSTIDDLSDVSITAHQMVSSFLVYNNTSGEWENQTVNISGSILGASDTTIANTQQYQITTMEWYDGDYNLILVFSIYQMLTD